MSGAELKRIIGLSDQFQSTLSFVSDQVSTFGRLKWINTADLQPAFHSPAYGRMIEYIGGLTHENLRDLVALAWLGRGFDGNDWNRLREQAQTMLGDEPAQHFRYISSLLPYVQTGIKKISSLRE